MASAFPGADGSRLPVGGRYRWAREGELHLWNPRTIPLLQHAVGLVSTGRSTRPRRREDYRAFATDAEADIRRAALRGQLRLREAAEPLPREQVEPAAEIVRRFATGAMSLGSLSPEAHETLAVAMNRIGGRSNTGEGGEDPRRYTGGDLPAARRSNRSPPPGSASPPPTWPTPTSSRSRSRKAPSPARAANCPATRSPTTSPPCGTRTPGVELISPPPHHDIYSIEDLKQLIFDLRRANAPPGSRSSSSPRPG